MIFKILKNGFSQTWNNKKLILIYYLINLVFGIIILLPFRAILNEYIGSSLMGQTLAGRLDMDFLFELFAHRGEALKSGMSLLLIVPVLYWLMQLFLSGGVLSLFFRQELFSAAQFWGDAAKYFGRFIRLVLWCIPAIIILFLLQFIWTGFQKLVFGADSMEAVLYYGAWIKVGLRYLSIILIAMVIDYARIHAVINDERKMRVSMWQGIKFAFGKFGKTFSLAFLFFLFSAIVLIIYNPIADLLHFPNSIVILLLFLLQQIYMLTTLFFKLAKYSSEVGLYKKVLEY